MNAHLGMGGQRVNIKLLNLLVAGRNEQSKDTAGVIDIEVCSLHVAHSGILDRLRIKIYTGIYQSNA